MDDRQDDGHDQRRQQHRHAAAPPPATREPQSPPKMVTLSAAPTSWPAPPCQGRVSPRVSTAACSRATPATRPPGARRRRGWHAWLRTACAWLAGPGGGPLRLGLLGCSLASWCSECSICRSRWASASSTASRLAATPARRALPAGLGLPAPRAPDDRGHDHRTRATARRAGCLRRRHDGTVHGLTSDGRRWVPLPRCCCEPGVGIRGRRQLWEGRMSGCIDAQQCGTRRWRPSAGSSMRGARRSRRAGRLGAGPRFCRR